MLITLDLLDIGCVLRAQDLERWFAPTQAKPESSSGGYGSQLSVLLDRKDFDTFKRLCRGLADQEVDWTQAVVFLTAEKPE